MVDISDSQFEFNQHELTNLRRHFIKPVEKEGPFGDFEMMVVAFASSKSHLSTSTVIDLVKKFIGNYNWINHLDGLRFPVKDKEQLDAKLDEAARYVLGRHLGLWRAEPAAVFVKQKQRASRGRR